MELIDAKWKIGEGRTVDLRLTGDGFDRVHPFKAFQKRRAGRVGTRFHMVCVFAGGEVVYDGQAMFAGWNDTSTKGQTVKFWLDDESTRHPFDGHQHRTLERAGQVFTVVLVEIDEDDKPIDQEARKKLEQVHKKRGRKLSQDADYMVKSERFVQYLRETVRFRPGREYTPENSKAYVKYKLGIESLSDLDHRLEKAKLFHEIIRRPFGRWNGQDVGDL